MEATQSPTTETQQIPSRRRRGRNPREYPSEELANDEAQKRRDAFLQGTYEQIEEGVWFGIEVDGRQRALKKERRETQDARMIQRGRILVTATREMLHEILNQLKPRFPNDHPIAEKIVGAYSKYNTREHVKDVIFEAFEALGLIFKFPDDGYIAPKEKRIYGYGHPETRQENEISADEEKRRWEFLQSVRPNLEENARAAAAVGDDRYLLLATSLNGQPICRVRSFPTHSRSSLINTLILIQSKIPETSDLLLRIKEILSAHKPDKQELADIVWTAFAEANLLYKYTN